MSWIDELSLHLLDDSELRTVFFLSWKNNVYKFKNIRIFLPKNGDGVIHELIEMDFIRITVKVHPEIVDSTYWLDCRGIFHALTERIQENFVEFWRK